MNPRRTAREWSAPFLVVSAEPTASSSPDITDESLMILLVRLFATDLGHDTTLADPTETARLCRRAILQRLIRGDLRSYLSRLIREVYLSEDALSAGLGIDDARQFLHWFDRRMQSDLRGLMGLPAAEADKE